MSIESQAVQHTIIEIAGEKLVAEVDRSGEIVKTWPAGDRSEIVIMASSNLKNQESKK